MSADVVATETSSEEPDTSPVMRRICEACSRVNAFFFLGAGVHGTPPDVSLGCTPRRPGLSSAGS